MELFYQTVVAKANYWAYVILMMIGLYAMIAKNNLIKKLVGMVIFQTAIILFYVSIGVKAEPGIPILSHDQIAHPDTAEVDPNAFSNPIPHVLMLTAIVVGVGTLGLALSIAQKVFQHYGTLEEDEILKQIGPGSDG